MSQRLSHRGFIVASVIGLASFALGMLFTGMTASGAVVTMNFTSPEGNQSGGVYVYPYNFTFDSSPTTYQLMCDDFVHEIMAPQTWTASALDAADLTPATVANLQFPSAGVTGYLEAADLFEEENNAYLASNSDPDGFYNWAVWDLMTGVDESAVLGATDDAIVQGDLSAVEAIGGGLIPAEFSNVVIYTPFDMSPGGPQEFLGFDTPVSSVPEPASIGVLMAGSMLLLGRRRKAGSPR